jgi:hypothetical protein
MNKLLLLFFISLILISCSGAVAASTPTTLLHQVKYVYASNENFCMGKITLQKSADKTEELILFPNGSAAEITVYLAEGQKAFMQADYMTSTKDLPCDVICRIYLDGELWREAKASGTQGTQAVCQGIVGQK